MKKAFTKTESKKLFNAFTLIELLIVCAIIAILSVLAVVGYSGAKAKSRDARRIADLNSLDAATRLLYADTKMFLGCACGNTSYAITNTLGFETVLVPSYISSVPTDPKFPTSTVYNEQYLYVTTDVDYGIVLGAEGSCDTLISTAKKYFFYAKMENSSGTYINLGKITKAEFVLLHTVPGIDVTNRYVVSGP